jgi:hypothetical protein
MIAGAVSAYSFALIHGAFISDIWFSLPALLIAGAICGLCLGWTYGLLFKKPSLSTWLQFNALFVGMFVLIGFISVLVFEPVTTLAAVMASDALPDDLILKGLPVTILSPIVMTVVIGRFFARTWTHYAAILLTCAVLVLLLGLNVAAIGLISIPRSSVYLVAELAGLILSLNVVFTVVFTVLTLNSFFGVIHRLRLPIGKH